MTGSTPRIDLRRHPNGLASLAPVAVNDTHQWLLIRSEDVANPVVLFLHGELRRAVLRDTSTRSTRRASG